MSHLKVDHLLIFTAFLASLVAYCVLSLDGKPVGTLEDILLALVGALAGVSLPRGPSS